GDRLRRFPQYAGAVPDRGVRDLHGGQGDQPPGAQEGSGTGGAEGRDRAAAGDPGQPEAVKGVPTNGRYLPLHGVPTNGRYLPLHGVPTNGRYLPGHAYRPTVGTYLAWRTDQRSVPTAPRR